MNTLCECPIAGYCGRHRIHKTHREHELCRGLNCRAQQSARYWQAWEAGRMSGQNGQAVEAPRDFDEQSPLATVNPPIVRGFGDWVSHKITSLTGIVPCGGCKQRAAWLNHFFPSTLPPIEPVALSRPVRHLMFHVFPTRGGDMWRWNCDQLLRRADAFNGRRLVSIATDGSTEPAAAVKEHLRGFTEEFLEFRNEPQLREVVSFVPMLERLEKYQSDQDLTFSCHAKGARHKIDAGNPNSTLPLWTRAMFETLLDSPQVACKALETAATYGTFRRFGSHQHGGWGIWHFTGTFYWFRNRDAFRRNWRYLPRRFYGTEAWPGLMFRPEEAATVIDSVADLYKLDYWQHVIEPQLAAWRAQHAAA